MSVVRRNCAVEESLDSTEKLVEVYNGERHEREIFALREWLLAYKKFQDPDTTDYSKNMVLQEMACLARIQRHSPQDCELVRSTLGFLAQQVRDGGVDVNEPMRALLSALQRIDVAVFGQDPSDVVRVANMLIDKLDPGSTAFTRGTYATHSITLCALHQALVLLQVISPELLHPLPKQGLFQAFKNKVQVLAECQDYFPCLFQVKLVEQCWEHLAYNPDLTLARAAKRALIFLMGCGYLYHGLRKLVEADIEVEAFENAYKYIKEALEKPVHKRNWYYQYLRLKLMTNTCCKDQDQECEFDNFKEEFNKAMELQQTKELKKEEKELLRFGIVDLLRSIALRGKTSEITEFGIEELVFLGTKHVAYEGWIENPAVFEAILDALQDVREQIKREQCNERVHQDCQGQFLSKRTDNTPHDAFQDDFDMFAKSEVEEVQVCALDWHWQSIRV